MGCGPSSCLAFSLGPGTVMEHTLPSSPTIQAPVTSCSREAPKYKEGLPSRRSKEAKSPSPPPRPHLETVRPKFGGGASPAELVQQLCP